MPSQVVVDFPLRGEWVAPNTPGTKVPSHGTDMLGQRYAFDFVRTDASARGMRFHCKSALRALVFGVRLQDCFGWGQPIHSPVAGTVAEAQDGWPERDPVLPVRDLFIALKNGLTFDPKRSGSLRALIGNYVIIESPVGYAVLAHAQNGSVLVSAGDRLDVGQPVARVGHSGNSTAPHLHFQMMDGPDALTASGLLCAFRAYEVLRDGEWHRVECAIPTASDRIRSCDA